MSKIPVSVKAAIVVYVAFGTITGTAEAAYHLARSPDATPSEGLRFMPEMVGMRTQPPPRYEPLRASGTATHKPVTIHEPVGGSLPPWSVIMCESKGSYTAENRYSTASGRYQIIDGTWNGYGGYSHASDAPPEVQDAKARELWANGAGRGHWRACL